MSAFLSRVRKIPIEITKNLNVLLLNESLNNVSRRIEDELRNHGASPKSVEVKTGADMVHAVARYRPELVICPFMKKRIPPALYKNTDTPCLVVHPGIAADRGSSSLDWAILQGSPEWGVTIVEADDDMDGGAIWSCSSFPVLPDSTKSALYNGAVADAAVNCALEAASKYSLKIPPIDKDDFPDYFGTCTQKRAMKNGDRRIEWHQSAEEVATRVRMSDTTPGAIAEVMIDGVIRNLRFYDAHLECPRDFRVRNLLKKAHAGTPVAIKDGAVLFATRGDTGVWIGQMKELSLMPRMKLPSSYFLRKPLREILDPCGFEEINVVREGSVCRVYFDFYNGAMSTDQALRLRRTLEEVAKEPNIKVVALMGGERFFSTGIHLCAIEHNTDKPQYAWTNINAIDDVIKTVVEMNDKCTVAVLRGNAGAGGAMFAAACDISVAHPGVCVTPTYHAIHLHGSEYWTYFLPQKVGPEMARTLTSGLGTYTARQAHSIGLLDYVLDTDKQNFEEEVCEDLREIALCPKTKDLIAHKLKTRDAKWFEELEKCRQHELGIMAENFKSNDFLNAMKDFVFKLPHPPELEEVLPANDKIRAGHFAV